MKVILFILSSQNIEAFISVRTKAKMETAGKNVLWKCFDKAVEKRKILENELPEGFSYVINRFKLLKESDIPHEAKFEAAFLVNICSEETTNQFVKDLESLTGTNFNLQHDKKKSALKNWKHKLLKCSRKVRDQTSTAKVEVDGKGAGSGRVKGNERQPGKNQECKTIMSLTQRPCKFEHCEGGCFNLSVELTHDHSHEVESTTAWNFLEVEESARLRLIELFETGLTPSRAKKVFEEELMAKYGDDWLKMSAKRSINPDTNYVTNLHTKYWKDRFGSINGPDAYQKAKEFIENYNKTSETNIASIMQLPNGSVVVAVVDEFSKRVHKVITQSGQICFIDATGSLDRVNHQLVKLMTESPSGGLPLGFLILSDQKQETLEAGFEELKKLLPEKAFAGRGAERGPELFMTDDDSVSDFQ